MRRGHRGSWVRSVIVFRQGAENSRAWSAKVHWGKAKVREEGALVITVCSRYGNNAVQRVTGREEGGVIVIIPDSVNEAVSGGCDKDALWGCNGINDSQVGEEASPAIVGKADFHHGGVPDRGDNIGGTGGT